MIMNESISGRGETSDYSIEAPSPNPLFQLTMDLKPQLGDVPKKFHLIWLRLLLQILKN